MIKSQNVFLLIYLIYQLHSTGSLAQLSNPIASNKQVDARNNKYLQRNAEEDDHSSLLCDTLLHVVTYTSGVTFLVRSILVKDKLMRQLSSKPCEGSTDEPMMTRRCLKAFAVPTSD